MEFKDFAIGVDVEEISRFSAVKKKTHRLFLEKIFSPEELRYCFAKSRPAMHLCARFSAKESVIKAVSRLSNNAVNHDKIAVQNDINGVPTVILKGKEFKNFIVKLSISHTKDLVFTTAVVVNNNYASQKTAKK
ncbi:MAG: holo-ACP synthase [Candidatus Taylorbacteria bacterium]|nr:holo-ACP synthase [Candidatus Taylorbacteria bacterium]